MDATATVTIRLLDRDLTCHVLDDGLIVVDERSLFDCVLPWSAERRRAWIDSPSFASKVRGLTSQLPLTSQYPIRVLTGTGVDRCRPEQDFLAFLRACALDDATTQGAADLRDRAQAILIELKDVSLRDRVEHSLLRPNNVVRAPKQYTTFWTGEVRKAIAKAVGTTPERIAGWHYTRLYEILYGADNLHKLRSVKRRNNTQALHQALGESEQDLRRKQEKIIEIGKKAKSPDEFWGQVKDQLGAVTFS